MLEFGHPICCLVDRITGEHRLIKHKDHEKAFVETVRIVGQPKSVKGGEKVGALCVCVSVSLCPCVSVCLCPCVHVSLYLCVPVLPWGALVCASRAVQKVVANNHIHTPASSFAD